MKTARLEKDMIHAGDLILVNQEHPYHEGEKKLISVSKEKQGVLLERKVASVLETIMEELGCKEQITVVSGWRSKEEQKQIYQDSLRENGIEFTRRYVAPAGNSEHQTGLAVDLALRAPEIDFIRPDFPYTGICGRFRDKAVWLGLTERYPQGKEDVTGIAHEPWHFRYVGAPHAIIMQQMDMTLEEYLGLLRSFPYGEAPLIYPLNGRDIKIFYVEAQGAETVVELDEPLFSVSGDNMEGFVVTVW